MSTLNGPDLSAGVAAVERLMDDTVTISTTTDAASWVLNKDTLKLEPPADTTLYTGKCKIRPAGSAQMTVTEQGGQFLGLDAYQLDIPIDSVALPEGCTAVMTSSRRFPQVVGAVFAVKRPMLKTLAVQARYAVERRTQVPA